MPPASKPTRRQAFKRVGIDPTGSQVQGILHRRSSSWFPISFLFTGLCGQDVGEQKAKIVTSIAMFYDLEDPAAFVRDIGQVLAPDGIWHFEQSYMPSMLRMNSYDTICHEHIEYYSLTPIKIVAGEQRIQNSRCTDERREWRKFCRDRFALQDGFL
jgi:hypothetical protein